MKIISAKTTLLYRRNRTIESNAVRVVYGRGAIITEIFTDEGVTGHSIITGMSAANQSEEDYLKYTLDRVVLPMIIGEDPFKREYIWKKLFRDTTRIGRMGAPVRAISAVDLALWDLAGKAYGMPVYKMIGQYRDEVACYASGGYYANIGENDIEMLVREFLDYKEMNFKAVKMKVGRLPVKEDVKRVARVKELIGDDIMLLVDANEAWTFNDALAFAKGVEPIGIGWLEEPLAPDDTIALKELCSRTTVPICCGETEYHKWSVNRIIDAGCKYINADLTRVGGITEMIKIAGICQLRNIPLSPHSIPELHVTIGACFPNTPFVEFWKAGRESQMLYDELMAESKKKMDVRPGVLKPVDEPGLGLTFDPDVIKKYKVDRVLDVI